MIFLFCLVFHFFYSLTDFKEKFSVKSNIYFKISEGFGYSFGVILEPLMTDFNSTRASVSFVGSLLSGVNAMFAPIFGALVNKFGMRVICISGSIIGCIGLSLSPLSTSVPLLMLTIGVIAGKDIR